MYEHSNDDFVDIPGFSWYKVNKKGDVFNTKRGNYPIGSVNPAGYRNFRLMSDKLGRVLTVGLHRILALAFLGEPADPSFCVNHIDGDKNNNDISNLEWISITANNLHAGAIGISARCSPILVRDVHTGEVMEYESMIAYAKIAGMSKDEIRYRLIQSDPRRVWPEGKQYQRLHKAVPWEKLEVSRTRPVACRSKGVYVKELITGYIRQFETLDRAAKFVGVSPPVLTRWFKYESQPVSPNAYQFKMVKDPDNWRYIQNISNEVMKYQRGRIVERTNIHTGQKERYPSTKACADATGIKITALNYRLRCAVDNAGFDGYTFKYVE